VELFSERFQAHGQAPYSAYENFKKNDGRIEKSDFPLQAQPKAGAAS
jgi:hypothetical protein